MQWKVFLMSCLLLAPTALLAEKVVKIYSTDGKKTLHGTVAFNNSSKGLVITTKLKNLSPGEHGFHIHQNPSCENKGMAAGGHYDPRHTGKHLGPDHKGHLGDLPVLVADKNGVANETLLAPRLTEKDLKGRSVMIHAHGDNYSDSPEKLGGGGARVACGVVK